MAVHYNGRARYINGKPIGTEYKPRGASRVYRSIPTIPRATKSQAAYLERHGLFLPGERRRLRKAAFEPEAVLPEEGDDEERAELMDLQPLGAA
jgi:hypothetical protein